MTALPTLFDTLSSLFQTDKVRNALLQRGRRTGTSATLDGALPLPQEALDLLCVYAACEDTPPVLGSYAHALVISTQNSKQRTKKVANHLVKKALAFSVPLEIDGEKNSKALATTDALTEKAASKVSAPSSKAVASAALSAATASATNSNSVEPGDSAVTPWVVGQGMEDATLQTLLSGGVVEARLLTELKTNNHFSSEEMCVRFWAVFLLTTAVRGR